MPELGLQSLELIAEVRLAEVEPLVREPLLVVGLVELLEPDDDKVLAMADTVDFEADLMKFSES